MKKTLFTLFLLINLTVFAQQTSYVDFKTANTNITFGNLKSNTVFGKVTYEFDVLKNTDSIYFDAKKIDTICATLNGKRFKTVYNKKQLILKSKFKTGTKHKVTITWKTHPKKAMYFIDWNNEGGNKQVWTQGQGKYTSNWLPSFDDMNEKVIFDLNIAFSKDYQVIANGKLTNKNITDTLINWQYKMQKPMSSYLLAFAIGKYSKKTAYSKSGIPLEMYYYPKDSLKFEPTYRYTKQMFDFLEAEIGVTYPWQNYKQVPVKDFLYAGMENTSTTIFSDAFLTDSIAFVDKNYVNVNAHELAHQWFGDLVTETSGTHHWLQEGFATYYALLAEKDIFGDNYYYWTLYDYTKELLAQELAGASTSILNPKSSSTTFYKKGAWVLEILRDRVGDKAFKAAVKNYLLKHKYKNVATQDFITEVEQVSKIDLSDFVEAWLVNKTFKNEFCLDYLKRKSTEIKAFLELKAELSTIENTSNIKDSRYFDIAHSFKIKSQILLNIKPELINNRIILDGLNSKNLKLRQAIAQTVSKIPLHLKEGFETLLDDASYVTIETMLFNLWSNFPEDRIIYLNKTKHIIGFNDKNVRMLWLTLALVTDDFEVKNKKQYFDELTDYTSSKYGADIRQSAFQYLNQIQACGTACKAHLQEATKHHNWRLSKFAKTLLKTN
ncbi:M1 family metallopeptidase [Postechiella marina]|uniref:Aminopeptidase N n=1 Tax=Postechiella marina TaxID=943941 RepID=A0ABP8C3F5_9FLAO